MPKNKQWNCGTCKYWDIHSLDDIGYKCHTPEMKIGICQIASYGSDHTEDRDYLSIATCNSEGIYGELVTQDSFGCIKYKDIKSLSK
jgi:hypothetical protein